MKSHTKDLSIAWEICSMFMLPAVIVMLPDFALATNNAMGNVLCTVSGWFTGNVGKGLATIAVTVIGLGALFGKVSWGMAIIVGVGIAIVFGAATIVERMGAGGNSSTPGCATS